MVDFKKIQEEKKRQYFLAINTFFPTILSLMPSRTIQLIPWLMKKFQIDETLANEIVSSWKQLYLYEGLGIDNYEDFLEYSKKYENAILSKSASFTKESFGKLAKYTLEPKDEYEQAKRWFCLCYMSEKYSSNLFEVNNG